VRTAPACAMQAQVFVTLGDAYWTHGRPDDARRVWLEGAAAFPAENGFRERLAADGAALKALTARTFNPWKRADTGTGPASGCAGV
jgi:hypothetical protein